MSNMAKQKGKRGEVQASTHLGNILSKHLGSKEGGLFRPDGSHRVWADVQAQSGDIVSIPGLSIEVKRQETLNVAMWWRQAARQADNLGAIPVLMYRQNRKPWRFCLPAYLLVLGADGYIEMDESVFASWLVNYLG